MILKSIATLLVLGAVTMGLASVTINGNPEENQATVQGSNSHGGKYTVDEKEIRTWMLAG